MKVLRSVKPFIIDMRKRTRSCSACSDPARNIANYDFDGVIIAEYYCDACAVLIGR